MKTRILMTVLAIVGVGMYFLIAPQAEPTASEAVVTVAPEEKIQQDGAHQNERLEPTASVNGAGNPNAKYSLPDPETIEEFKAIQLKIFKSDTETERKNEILNDAHYLSRLSRFLRNPANAKDPQFEQDQNTVIDILISAYQGGDQEMAQQAILDIIKDPQVEDSRLDAQTRASLAGVKAEIMYNASAANPEAFADIDRLLPGPVSQKIWLRVQQKQRNNLQESEAERNSLVKI